MLWIIPVPSSNTILNLVRAGFVLALFLALLGFTVGPSWALLRSEYWLLGLCFLGVITATVFWTFLGQKKGRWKRGTLALGSMCIAWGVFAFLLNTQTSDARDQGEIIADFIGDRSSYDGVQTTAFLEDLMPDSVRYAVQHINISISDGSTGSADGERGGLERPNPIVPGSEPPNQKHYWVVFTQKSGQTADEHTALISGLNDFYGSPWVRLNACGQFDAVPEYCSSISSMEAKTGLDIRRAMSAHLAKMGKACVDSLACRQLSNVTEERVALENDVFGPAAPRGEVFGNCTRWWGGDRYGCDCMNSRVKENADAREYAILEDLYARDAEVSLNGRSMLTDRSTIEAAIENKFVGAAAEICFPKLTRIEQ